MGRAGLPKRVRSRPKWHYFGFSQSQTVVSATQNPFGLVYTSTWLEQRVNAFGRESERRLR